MNSFLILFTLLNVVISICSRCAERQDLSFVCRGRNHKHSGFPTSFPSSDTKIRAKHHQQSQYILTKHEYVHIVLRYLETNYWKNECLCSKEDVKHALGYIYDMLHRNIHGLIVFTSHIIFNTGGLLKLQAGEEKWASRGILQITGRDNYEKLAHITRDNHFLRHPHMLATLQKHAVEGSVLFWLDLLRKHFGDYENAKISLRKTLLLLNPHEVRSFLNPESEKKINNREKIYKELRKALERRNECR